MRRSSLGSLRASGAWTLRAPDCSSLLGRYVPSVCLLFFTRSTTATATPASSSRPRITVGATMAGMLGPGELVVEFFVVLG